MRFKSLFVKSMGLLGMAWLLLARTVGATQTQSGSVVPVSEGYLGALKEPLVMWNHPDNGPSFIINPEINIDSFSVKFSGTPGTTPLTAEVNTPRMILKSMYYPDLHMSVQERLRNPITYLTSVANRWADTEFVANEVYAKEVTDHYADGKPKTYKDAENRLSFFSNWWHKGSPFSGLMAYSKETGERLGMFNIGGSDRGPTVAECAAMLPVAHQNKDYGTEAGLGLLFYSKAMKDNGFKMRDGSEYSSVGFTARDRSLGIARKLKLNEAATTDKYGPGAENERVIVEQPVDSLIQVIENTGAHRARATMIS